LRRGDTYEEEGGLGGVDVGEDFDALFLVGGDELVEGIVSLAEVSAVSLATIPATYIPQFLRQFSTLKCGVFWFDRSWTGAVASAQRKGLTQ